MNIGILALQGAVQDHKNKFSELGTNTIEVRRSGDLLNLDGLILPGGESSTMLKLLNKNELWSELHSFIKTKPSWGICAGLILIAKSVHSPQQKSLGVLDVDVERNAYGRQLDSFITNDLVFNNNGKQSTTEGVFIRAPKINRIGADVKTTVTHDNQPVMVESNLTLGSSFHPERSEGHIYHKYFLEKIRHINE